MRGVMNLVIYLLEVVDDEVRHGRSPVLSTWPSRAKLRWNSLRPARHELCYLDCTLVYPAYPRSLHSQAVFAVPRASL